VDDPLSELNRTFWIDAVATRFIGLTERLRSGNFLRLATVFGGTSRFALHFGAMRFYFMNASLIIFNFDFTATLRTLFRRPQRL